MLVDTFINPLNLPNLLTPFRYNLEIQYVIFSILFVSLLGYVLFTFLDYITSIDKIIILLGVFVVLLFLFLVIKERDRLDELTLQEEAVDMAQELATIERDIKVKEFLKEEAKKGVIYDENDNRIEKGKADTAKVNNFRSEINKLQTRKKEILEKQKNFDTTFLEEANGQVKSSAESEMIQLTKRNRDLEKKVERITGSSSQRLDNLLSKKADIEFQLGQAKESSGGDKKDKTVEDLNNELKKIKGQIENEEESLGDIEINAKTRVELDRARREMKELRDRRKNIEGLYGDSDVLKRDINILKKNEIYKAEEEKNKANENYIKARKANDLNSTTETKKALTEATKELNKNIREYNSLLGNQRFDAGNRGLEKAEKLIDTYDQSVKGRGNENKYKQLSVYKKLEGLENEALKASKLSKTAADLVESYNGTDKDKIEMLSRTVREYVPKESNLSKEQIKEVLLDPNLNDLEKAAASAALVKYEKQIHEQGISEQNINIDDIYNQELTTIENTVNNPDFQNKEDSIKYGTALLSEITGKDDNEARRLIEAENKIKRGPKRAENDTYNLVFNKDKQNVKERLGNSIYSSDSYGTRNKKAAFSAVENEMKERFLENVETFDNLISNDLVPGAYDTEGDPEYDSGHIKTNGGNDQFKRENDTYKGKNLKDFKDLVNQLSSQLKENPDVETGYPNRAMLGKILKTQQKWLEESGI